MNGETRIPIIGIGGDGVGGLTSRARDLLGSAELILGSEAVLRLLPESPTPRYRIGTDLHETLELIRSQSGQKRLVIVSAGDPLFYGIARFLCDRLGKDRFEVLPHVSTMQLAFARIKETWEDAYLTDLSTRSLDDVLDRVRTSETVGLFTSETHSPPHIARELLARGIDYFRAYVCENLGGPDERLTQAELSEIVDMHFDPLNVLILKRKPGRPNVPAVRSSYLRFGNPDDAFAQSKPQSNIITQAEVRAITLAQLNVHAGCVFWDVGAGSGSVAIEAAQLAAPGTVYAIEQDPADYHLILANAEKFGVRNVKAIHGTAPAIFHGLPRPDAIFVGGTGREVVSLLEASFAALRPGGRLAVNVASLEALSAVYATLKRLGSVQVLLLQMARGVEQLETLRFDALSPTFLLTVTQRVDS